jgi:hypothetical protein
MPERIQFQRTAGWRKPVEAAVVTRATPWGNPFKGPVRSVVLAEYRAWIGLDLGYADTVRIGARTFDRRWVVEHLRVLRGRDLACFCPLDLSCHADVLLELANQ